MKKRTRKKSFGRGRNRGSSRRWDERIHEEIWIAKKKKIIKKYQGKNITKKKKKNNLAEISNCLWKWWWCIQNQSYKILKSAGALKKSNDFYRLSMSLRVRKNTLGINLIPL